MIPAAADQFVGCTKIAIMYGDCTKNEIVYGPFLHNGRKRFGFFMNVSNFEQHQTILIGHFAYLTVFSMFFSVHNRSFCAVGVHNRSFLECPAKTQLAMAPVRGCSYKKRNPSQTGFRFLLLSVLFDVRIFEVCIFELVIPGIVILSAVIAGVGSTFRLAGLRSVFCSVFRGIRSRRIDAARGL